MQKLFSSIFDTAARVLRRLAAWIQLLFAPLIGAIKAFPQAVVRLIRSLPSLPMQLGVWFGDVTLSFTSMVIVVYKRLRHNIGLSVSALLGIVVILGFVVCVPVFSYTVSSEVLHSELQAKMETTHRGLFSLHVYYVDNTDKSPLNVSKVDTISKYITDGSQRLMGLKVKQLLSEIQSSTIEMNPVKVGSTKPMDGPWATMHFDSLEKLPENGKIVDGKWPQTTSSGPIQVAIIKETADTDFMNVGDIFQFKDSQIEITGIWEPRDPLSQFWFDEPKTAFFDKLWVPLKTYETRLSFLPRPIFYTSWYITMDQADVNFQRAPQYVQGLVRLDSDLKGLLPGITTDYTPIEALKTYQDRATSLTTLFYAVGGPMIILALLFITLTATIAVQQYEHETAAMRGRGTSWLQVLSLNLIESILLILISLPFSMWVGWLAASVIDHTVSFLKFTNRAGIPFSLDGINLMWLFIGAFAIILARFIPMLEISHTTIIGLKQSQSRGMQKPFWQRFYLDFLLLIPGVYSYVTLSGMAKPVGFLSQIPIGTGQPYHDPLLYIAPALFAMALCMLSLRLLPLLLKLLAFVVDRLPGTWAYLSFQQIARRPQDHASALLLIMISLSLSIFSASTAKTLDQWLNDSVFYKVGADLVVHEYAVQGGQNNGGPDSGGNNTTTMSELDLNNTSYLSLDDHLKLPNVKAVTRVGKYDGTVTYGAGSSQAKFMGIDRLGFPNVGFYRSDFAKESLGALMNDLGANANGVLVPRQLSTEAGLRIGDKLSASISVLNQSYDRELVVAGFYDYFPTIFPDKVPTLIVNLDSIFDNPDDVIGYDVWLDLKKNAKTDLVVYQIRQMLGYNDSIVKIRGNAVDEINKAIDQPERVGLFGVLNVGFIATGLMPAIGFVLYSYASLRRRFVQLGILQAIGLSVKQLIGYLASEQFLLMGLSIVVGAAIGLITSHFFVPFLQVNASGGAPVPPFALLMGWAESAWLSLAFGVVLALTMIGTIMSLARLKVFEAVKMGESL
jgi:putative ABC transport system permease protein